MNRHASATGAPAQVAARQIFHGVVVAILQNSVIQNADNAGMRQGADYFDFPHKAGARGRADRGAFSHDFECPPFVRFRVDTQIDLGDSASPEPLHKVKPVDFCSQQSHGSSVRRAGRTAP
jgi:hypothetical protein